MKKITILLLCLLTVAVAHAQSYKLIVLDEIGTEESGAYDVNNYGFVVGYNVVGANTVPYIWSANRGYYALSTPAGSISQSGVAYAINDYLEIGGTFGYAGTSPIFKVANNGTAAVWTLNSDETDFLAYNLIADSATCRDINNNGDIAGTLGYTSIVKNIFTGDGYFSAPLWTFGQSVNDNGDMTGMVNTTGSFYSATFAKKQTNGTYTFTHGVDTVSYGMKINNSDQIVGGSYYGGGFLWEPLNGKLIFFGSGTACYSINNNNQIVGITNGHAAMWTLVGTNFVGTDLNRLTGDTNIVLETAMSINEKGQIVGRCLNLQTGVRKAYLLTPAKETPRKLEYHNGAVVLSWQTTLGHNYIVQSSLDLVNWSDYSDVLSAYSTTFEGNVDSSYHHLFFKVIDVTP